MLATIAVVVAVMIGPAPERDNAVAAQGSVDSGATNGACGFGEYPPCKIAEDACVLLTADDVVAVFGGAWTRQGSGPMRPLPGAALIDDCQYDGPAEGEDVILTVHDGGRAQFDDTVHKLGRGPTALSGVGDAAYSFASPGSSPPQVELWVVKGATYFNMMLNSNSPNLASGAATLASKIANRVK